MSTLTADPSPATEAVQLLAAFRELERFLGRNPEKSPTVQVPWETPLLIDFIDLVLQHKLWLVADHFLTHLASRGKLTREQAALAARVRNFKATMFVQVGQVLPDSPMGKAIFEYVATYKPTTILDVGAAAGLGTTTTFSKALQAASITHATIHAIESEPATFDLLAKNAAALPYVKPIHSALITDTDCPDWNTLRADIAARSALLSQFPDDELHGWYCHGLDLLRSLRLSGKGPLRDLPGTIDIAMIDADLFFAREELAVILPRTRIVLLDDVHAYKNAYNHDFLAKHPDFQLLAHNPSDRHGWSAFIRR